MPWMLYAPPGRWNATVTGERTSIFVNAKRPVSARSEQKSRTTGAVPPASPSVTVLMVLVLLEMRSDVPCPQMTGVVR